MWLTYEDYFFQSIESYMWSTKKIFLKVSCKPNKKRDRKKVHFCNLLNTAPCLEHFSHYQFELFRAVLGLGSRSAISRVASPQKSIEYGYPQTTQNYPQNTES
eukprot:TRINITY_DN13460_c1_g1_i1.p2 TRINITY_DN13460_c1_g1~~TRINITY_DN13460_c1_g1_i1.p2  ORF type:complete len:103 (-),score=0.29 TRINITY_DN13460_c1_g1_i1:101-409(-)